MVSKNKIFLRLVTAAPALSSSPPFTYGQHQVTGSEAKGRDRERAREAQGPGNPLAGRDSNKRGTQGGGGGKDLENKRGGGR